MWSSWTHDTHIGRCFSSAKIALSGFMSYLAKKSSSTTDEISSNGFPNPHNSPSLHKTKKNVLKEFKNSIMQHTLT